MSEVLELEKQGWVKDCMWKDLMYDVGIAYLNANIPNYEVLKMQWSRSIYSIMFTGDVPVWITVQMI